MTIARPLVDPFSRVLAGPLTSSLPWESGGSGVAPIEQQIQALLGASGSSWFAQVRASAVDSLTAVGSLTPQFGSGAATQASAGAKPAYNATGLNGRPSLTFAADDALVTAAQDRSAHEYLILVLVLSASNSSIFVAGEFGSLNDSDLGCVRHVHREAANRIAGQGRAGAGIAETRVSPQVLTSPCVAGISVDYSLTTRCVEIWFNGAIASSATGNAGGTSYVTDTNLSASIGANKPLYIGNRAALDLGLSGELSAILMYSQAATPTAGELANIAAAQRALMTEYGIA